MILCDFQTYFFRAMKDIVLFFYIMNLKVYRPNIYTWIQIVRHLSKIDMTVYAQS